MFKCGMSIILIMLNEWWIQVFPHGGVPTPKIAIIFQSLANENYFIFRERNKIPKIEKFYEVIIPKMAPRHFRRYF